MDPNVPNPTAKRKTQNAKLHEFHHKVSLELHKSIKKLPKISHKTIQKIILKIHIIIQ